MDPLAHSFLTFAAACRPDCGGMLIAIEREFRAVHHVAVEERLDDLSRGLFELGSDASPEDRVLAIARTAWTALPWEGSEPQHWLFSSALEQQTASGPVRAALALEIGRRAGCAPTVARARGCWLVHVAHSEVAADMGRDTIERECPAATGSFCAHALALLALTGLAAAWRARGDSPRARRASGMRLLLPLDEATREAVEADVRRDGARA